MQIRLAADSDRQDWDAYVLGHPEGTAYQLFAWKEAVATAYGFSGRYLLAEGGHGLCGVLPLIVFRIPVLGATFISLPYCDAGGVLADNDAVAAALLDHARALAAEENAGCSIRSNVPLATDRGGGSGKVRMLLDLPDSSERLLAGLTSKLRSQANKPLRDGLSVRSGGGELVDVFYAIFSENMRLLGSPVHSRRWFEAVAAAYGDRARIAVVSMPNGAPAAAGLLLLHPKTATLPWASSLRRHNRSNPNMLLYRSLLAYAADRGIRRFDFGRSTPGSGTYRFKQQWGAEPRQLYWYELHRREATGEADGRGHAPSRKRQVAAALWRRLPRSGAGWLGPKVRKYISL